jgi:hypothetical protein
LEAIRPLSYLKSKVESPRILRAGFNQALTSADSSNSNSPWHKQSTKNSVLRSKNESSDSQADDSAKKLIEQFYKEDYLQYKQSVVIPKEAAVALSESFNRLERINSKKSSGLESKFRRKSTRRTISIGNNSSVSITSITGGSFASKTFERRMSTNPTKP